MKKYLTLFGLSWQKQLEVRSDFLFERSRSVSLLFALYFLWTAIFTTQKLFLGYTKPELLSYVILMSFLRAWVLGCVTDRIPSEIARGKLSDVLLKPMSYLSFWATQDLANKALNISFAVLEMVLFVVVARPILFYQTNPVLLGFFFLSTIGGMILYFQMSYLLGVVGFWTSESWGPRFCFEIILEFSAGAYFPLNLLPDFLQKGLSLLPFPYLVFYPLSIYLGKTSTSEIFSIFIHQLVWIGVLSVLIKALWGKGLAVYGAEGR